MATELDNLIPAPFRDYRRLPMDEALLLFDRATGNNVLLDGEEFSGLRQRAPRALQFGITNACNLSCGFCSRNLGAASTWTVDEAFAWLQHFSQAGLLEVAFGGGEPLAFRGFEELCRRLQTETELAVHFTTNGLLLDAARIKALAPHVQECRVSVYEDNDWEATLERLGRAGMRFGINYLLTPERVDQLESRVLSFVAAGCKDVLLLSYNGPYRSMHLDAESCSALATRVPPLQRALQGRCTLKLDVCWGQRLAEVPRLFDRPDCGAGRDHMVLTSDKRVMACSFHHDSKPVASPQEALGLWNDARLLAASSIPGCARLPDFGLQPAAALSS